MEATRKRRRTEVAPSVDEPVAPLRQATFVVWRGKLQSSLCVTAREIPTVSPLAAWRVYEPAKPGAALVPRRRRMGC
jgi:hypothetical protein